MSYRLEGSSLIVSATILNSGGSPMPVSFGFHPAFRWPLPYGGARAAHEIRFERMEPEPMRVLVDNLLGTTVQESPIEGDRLTLRDALFSNGALIFDRIRSRNVEYGVPGQRSIKVGFAGMPHLGVWTKPGAGFICIEPWQGHASPVGFDGEFAEKRGVVLVSPGDTRKFAMEISLSDP
ncbi:MAG: aldose epimerase [Microvirga sp.]|nr:aldose epimerase [Microvirga sp.]